LLTIRKAELRDVPAIFGLINYYAAERVVLPRTLRELYENVREFTVAEVEGKVLGCGALKFYSDEIAEIRSLCVDGTEQAHGLGRALTERLVREAAGHGLKTVFALTLATRFFLKCGFREVPRASLPMKIWRDCIHCDKYFHCDEITVALDLPQPAASSAPSAAEPSEVSV